MNINLGELMRSAPTSTDCPKGTMTLQVTSAESVVSKAGNPMLNLTCRVVDGDYVGRRIYERIVITDNPDALFFLAQKLTAWGVNEQALLDLCVGTLEPLADAIIGKRARVVVEEDEYKGKPKPVIAEYLGAGGDSAPAAVSAASDEPDFFGS